jgi:stage II sporulation protein D
MKKIIIFITLLIFIPFFIVIIYNKNYKEIQLEYINITYIRVKQLKKDKIIKIPLEEYIVGVLAGEMPIDFDLEALKAQAIASRTYLVNHLLTNDSITNTTDDQVYLTKEEMQTKWLNNYKTYYNKIKQAVHDTKGLIMYHSNKPIKAYYFSSSNGYTESSLNVFNEYQEYLTIIESPFDQYNTHTIEIPKQDFCTKLDIQCNKITITNIEKDKSNRISSITINNKVFKGTELRKLLSLRSTDITININNNMIEITTNGYGHGVGMSQNGANYLAKQGYTYKEILNYYYQDIKIDSI